MSSLMLLIRFQYDVTRVSAGPKGRGQRTKRDGVAPGFGPKSLGSPRDRDASIGRQRSVLDKLWSGATMLVEKL